MAPQPLTAKRVRRSTSVEPRHTVRAGACELSGQFQGSSKGLFAITPIIHSRRKWMNYPHNPLCARASEPSGMDAFGGRLELREGGETDADSHFDTPLGGRLGSK